MKFRLGPALEACDGLVDLHDEGADIRKIGFRVGPAQILLKSVDELIFIKTHSSLKALQLVDPPVYIESFIGAEIFLLI